MKQYAVVAMLGTVLLTGCAGTQQSNNTSQSATQNAVPSQPVSVPAGSAKNVVLNMTGPKNVTGSSSWTSFKEEWRATFADHAEAAGTTFSLQEGEAKPTGAAGTLLNVYVNDFRQVGIGSRIFFGAMTGNAYIDANLTFNDLKTGTTFGAQTYNTTSSAWQGVFGKMTPQQVDSIATGVFHELKSAR